MDLNTLKNSLSSAARKGLSFVEEKAEAARTTTQEKIIPGAKKAANKVMSGIEESEARRRAEVAAYKLINQMTSCNDCADRTKECCPKWGEPARYNCYWWSGKNEEVSDDCVELPTSNKRRNLK